MGPGKDLSVIFTFLLVFVMTFGFAQDSIRPITADQKSYELYLGKNWRDLVTFGEAAIKKGDDYFYLRMRIGIAYYELSNYNGAEKHFRKALSFNSTDALALEYLYYCYIFTGRTDEARWLSKQFSEELAKKIGTDKQSDIDFVIVEGGTKITDSMSYYDKNTKAHTNFFDPAVYLQLGFKYTYNNRMSFFHAFTYFSQVTHLGDLRQVQYYIRNSLPLKRNWLLSPAVHWVNINFTSEVRPPPGNPQRPGSPNQTTVTTSNYFVGSLAIQKNLNKVIFSLGTTISNIQDQTQILNSGFVSYSLFGNSKVVIGGTAYLHTLDTYSTMHTSYSPFLYLQPLDRFSMKLSYLINTHNNIIEDNGYLVNNSPDLTESRYAIIGTFQANQQLSIYGLYQLEFKKESKQEFNYRYNVIVAGIKFVPKNREKTKVYEN